MFALKHYETKMLADTLAERWAVICKLLPKLHPTPSVLTKCSGSTDSFIPRIIDSVVETFLQDFGPY